MQIKSLRIYVKPLYYQTRARKIGPVAKEVVEAFILVPHLGGVGVVADLGFNAKKKDHQRSSKFPQNPHQMPI